MSFVLAITGPTGSGKSTVADNFAKLIKKCVNIDADHIKHLIVSGFIYDETEEGIKQWELLGKNIGLLAYNFINAGFNVIINGYINEPAWNEIEKHVTLNHKIVLLPHLDTVKRRDEGRIAEEKMGLHAVQKHYSYFSGNSFFNDYIRMDTTNHSEDETVNAIITILGYKNEN